VSHWCLFRIVFCTADSREDTQIVSPPPNVSVGNGLDDWGVGVLFISAEPGEVWRLPSLVLSGYSSDFPRGNLWLGPEPDHSALSSAEDKNGWSCML
jgi:hypothetical protein